MKLRNLFIVLLGSAILYSCGNDKTQDKEKKTDTEKEPNKEITMLETHHANGMIDSRFYVKMDEKENFIREGTFRSWYDNGLLEEKGEFKDNKKQGLWKYWDDKGNLYRELDFVDNQLEGNYKKYYSNGKIWMKGQLKNNKKDGEWTIYHLNGKKKSKGIMEDNKKTGVWKNWDAEGNPLKDTKF